MIRLAWLVPAIAGCSLVVDIPDVEEGRRPEDVRRKRIEITAPIAEDELDYPLAVRMTDDPDLSGRAFPDNLAFFDEAGARLPHELQSFDAEAGALLAWVRIPRLLATAPTVIYLHYGGPDREQPDSSEVWPPGYAGVWHLDGSGRNFGDSTGARNAADVTTPQEPIPADDGSLVFAGDAMLEIQDPEGGELDFGDGSFSYSLWARVDELPSGSSFPLRKGGVPETSAGYAFQLDGEDWVAAVSDASNQRELGGSAVLGAWTMLVGIVDREPEAGDPSFCVYIDGETISHAGMSDVESVSSSQNIVIGEAFVGRIDEVRIYSEAISKDRVILDYRTFAFPENILVISGEQEP